MSKISLKSVSKIFNNKHILKDLDFEFDSKYSYGITGVSGSGKSTLLSLISGLDFPNSGDIYFDNINIKDLKSEGKSIFLNKKIGFIFQSPYLIQELTVLENVIIKSTIENKNHLNTIQEALELLDYFGLKDKAFLYPNVLSGGEQQRISIARAIFNKPLFLIADEPTAHLDKNNTDNIIKLLKDSSKEYNIGLIIASHDQNLINSLDIKYSINK